MRSPSRTAAHAATAPARAACTDLNRTRVPKYIEAAVSATIRLSRSRSAWNSLVWARPVRAVRRQSMWRASSPLEYSRDSAYSMPRPRRGDSACPLTPKRPRRAWPRAVTTERNATSSASDGVRPLPTAAGSSSPARIEVIASLRAIGSGQGHPLQQFGHQAIAVPAFGRGFVAGQDAVAQHVGCDDTDIVGGHEVAAGQPGVCTCATLQRDRAARAGAPCNAP